MQHSNRVTLSHDDEAILLREMRRHYAATLMRERMKQARITGRL